MVTIKYIGKNPNFQTIFLEGLFDNTQSNTIEVSENTAKSVTSGENSIWEIVEKPIETLFNTIENESSNNISDENIESNSVKKTSKKSKKNE